MSDIQTVRVGGFDIRIESDAQCTRDLQNMGLCAQFVTLQSKIVIRDDMDEQVQAQSLVHEIGHAIESVYLESDGLTERQIAAFTQGLYQVLRDNRALIEMIMDARSTGEEDNDDNGSM